MSQPLEGFRSSFPNVRAFVAQPRAVCSQMDIIPGVRVVNYKSVFSHLRFIPSHRGLVRVDVHLGS
jgi:hypothetical protein